MGKQIQHKCSEWKKNHHLIWYLTAQTYIELVTKEKKQKTIKFYFTGLWVNEFGHQQS